VAVGSLLADFFFEHAHPHRRIASATCLIANPAVHAVVCYSNFLWRFFMPYKLCQHVKENGTFCSSAALKGRKYCYFHLRVRARRLAMAQAGAEKRTWHLDLPALEDMHAVQSSIMQVVDALARGALDPQIAKQILYGLQQAGTNVRYVNSWIPNSPFTVHEYDEMRAIDYPGLEAEFGLPRRIDLDASPEAVFPPPPIDAAAGNAAPARKPPANVKKLKAAEEEDPAEVG
jgi:hypothetical protein